MRPSYLALYETGELNKRVEEACQILDCCMVCPRNCQVNRNLGERGYCQSGRFLMISSYGPHFGEEPPLVGTHGSGTIFLTNCNMRCEFCQNFEISQCGQGVEISCQQLAAIMVRLQDRGCHNINFVSPSHFVPQILKGVAIAAGMGLGIPLVYNSGGYDAVETLRLLDGVFDIYMPDAKYGRDEIALRLSHAREYTQHMKSALREMHRQVGDLNIVEGLAVRGLLIRHLVLPHNLANSEIVMQFIGEELSRETYMNIMDQYRPTWHVVEGSNDPLFRLLRRSITHEEYVYAIRCARDSGLHRGF
jgi:putative pyruvate formate lyase activating enzyme